MIAPPCLDDETSLVHVRLLSGTTWLVALTRVWRLPPAKHSFTLGGVAAARSGGLRRVAGDGAIGSG
jgi:hypothetical protein